jgi:hypothetical protein
VKPKLKAPGTKRLKLKYDEPLSNFAFKFNLRRYIKVMDESFGIVKGIMTTTHSYTGGARRHCAPHPCLCRSRSQTVLRLRQTVLMLDRSDRNEPS